MARLTSYAGLIGGYRRIAQGTAGFTDKNIPSQSESEKKVSPFEQRISPMRKKIPEEILREKQAMLPDGQNSALTPMPSKEIVLKDSDAAFFLDFQTPFLRAISKFDAPSDAVFRERAVYWDLLPARAAYGKVLYRQNTFFVNRKQDSALGTNLNDFY